MPSANSLEKRLMGKEAGVLEVIRLKGIGSAMEAYGIKTRRTFMRWLREHTGITLFPNKLAEMTGGEKAKWLRDHRETVLDCLSCFGEDFVVQTFNLGNHNNKNTLANLILSDAKPFTQKLNRIDRVELKANSALQMAQDALRKAEIQDCRIDIIAQGQRDNLRAIEELKGIFGRFQEGVSGRISKMILEPFIQHLISVDETMDLPKRPDPLNLESFIDRGNGEKAEENPLLNATKTLKP